jgi:hypothetical protein
MSFHEERALAHGKQHAFTKKKKPNEGYIDFLTFFKALATR